MHWAHDHLQSMSDGPRLFFRSGHIYLLWSSLLNMALGCYLVRIEARRLQQIQTTASMAVILGPMLLCFSFFFEPYSAGLSRPVGRLGIYLALGGILSHVVATLLCAVKPRES